MRIPLFCVVLFAVQCLASVAWAQETLGLKLMDGGVEIPYEIKITTELVYTQSNGTNDGPAIKLSELPKGVLPIFNEKYAKLRLTIALPDNPAVSLGNRAALELSVKASGAFAPPSSTSLRLRKRDGYQGSIDIPIIQGGTGSLQLSFLSLDGKPFKDNRKEDTLRVCSIGEFPHVHTLPQGTTAQRARKVRENAQVLDYYKHFIGAAYTAVDGYSSVRILFDNSEQIVKDIHDTMLPSSYDDYTGAIALFEVFGQPELSNHRHPIVKAYYNEAKSLLASAEQRYTRTISATGILALEAARKEYEALFCKRKGYQCQYLSKYDEEIAAFVKRWKDGGTSAPDYCKIWSDIQASDYYAARKNSTQFSAAEGLCEQNPCQDVKTQYPRASSIRALSDLLAKCKSSGCDDGLCNAISDRIVYIDCQDKLRRAEREPDVLERRSRLQELSQLAKCASVAEQARQLLDSIQSLVIKGDEGPKEVRDPSTGRRTWTYTLFFDSGQEIVVLSVDERPLDSLTGIYFNWVQEDRELEINVDDPEQDYMLKFRSDATGEEAEYELTKRKFEAKVAITDDLIIFELANGRSPYFARFVQTDTGNSFDIKLKSPADTLSIAQLAQNYPGQYELVAVDNNGKMGMEAATPVQLAAGFNPCLWLWLLPFLLPLIGFLLYRNLSPQI